MNPFRRFQEWREARREEYRQAGIRIDGSGLFPLPGERRRLRESAQHAEALMEARRQLREKEQGR